MAIRTILLKKKISDQKKALEALTSKRDGFDQARAELEKREAELETAIEEASTDEERTAVEEAVTAFEADKTTFDNDVNDTDKQIADIETEVSEMERELSELEEAQERTVPPLPDKAPEETPKKASKKSGGKRTMFKTRALRQMTVVEREALVNHDETQEFLKKIRSLIAEKRGLSGGEYTITETIMGLIREDVIEYSKLYKHCRVARLSGKGREIVMGTAPEAFWEEACDPIYELAASMAQVEVDQFKVAGYIPLCNALLEDSDIDLLDEIMSLILQSIGFALDKAIVYGTGVKMPTGVVTAIDDDDAIKLTNEVTIPTASSSGVDLFKALLGAVAETENSYARGDLTWIMNGKTYRRLQAESLSINAAGLLVSAVNGTFPVLGGAMEVLNFIPAKNIVVGYFELYVLAERKGMTIDQSEHVKFIQDQTVVRGRARYDGKPAVVKAFAVIGFDNTAPTTSVDFANPSQG